MYHVDMSEFQQWITGVTGGASWRTIADKLGTTHPTIQRRLKNDTASAVIELARAYGTNPIPGLLASGCITRSDMDEHFQEASLSSYTDLELAQEIVRRLEEKDHDELATVYEFQAVADSSPDEDALRARQEWNDFE